MPSTLTTHIIVDSSRGRGSDEEWEQIESEWITFWKRALPSLRTRSYEHDGTTVTIELDWAPYLRRLVKHHNLLAPIRRGEAGDPNWITKLDRPLKLKAICSITGENSLTQYSWYSDFFLQYYLYEIFICANLGSPGSADFFGFEIGAQTRSRTHKLGLAAYYFDEWSVASIKGQVPPAANIDPAIVVAWVRAVNPTVTQRAETGTQRALFAIYHMCRNDGHIDFVVWLFTALESLLSTKVGENFSGMARRASLVLGLDKTGQKRLSNRLRELYNLRSSFVHGGYAVAHPLHHESIDPRLDEDYGKVIQLSTYGFGILMAILQAMILANRQLLEFEERIVERGGAA
jgi:Apea-like HEPN